MQQDHPRHAQEPNQDGRQDSPQDVLDRLTVAQAADRLGITQDAVRKRIARGTIRHEKDHEGRIFVYLDTFEGESKTNQDNGQDGESKTVSDTGQDKYTRSLEDQIGFLRQELERKDAIIMSLTQRIPELEAPKEASSETRESRETVSESPAKDPSRAEWPVRHEEETYGTSAEEAEESLHRQHKRSWWRAFFGLE